LVNGRKGKGNEGREEGFGLAQDAWGKKGGGYLGLKEATIASADDRKKTFTISMKKADREGEKSAHSTNRRHELDPHQNETVAI